MGRDRAVASLAMFLVCIYTTPVLNLAQLSQCSESVRTQFSPAESLGP